MCIRTLESELTNQNVNEVIRYEVTRYEVIR